MTNIHPPQTQRSQIRSRYRYRFSDLFFLFEEPQQFYSLEWRFWIFWVYGLKRSVSCFSLSEPSMVIFLFFGRGLSTFLLRSGLDKVGNRSFLVKTGRVLRDANFLKILAGDLATGILSLGLVSFFLGFTLTTLASNLYQSHYPKHSFYQYLRHYRHRFQPRSLSYAN